MKFVAIYFVQYVHYKKLQGSSKNVLELHIIIGYEKINIKQHITRRCTVQELYNAKKI